MSYAAARTLTRLVLLALAGSGASCAIPAWIAAQFAPPQKIDPVYELPEGKTVLVFVDDMVRPVSYPGIKPELTRRINEQLEKNEVAADTIGYRRLADLVASTPAFNDLAVSEVGRKLGADLVLYVQIDEFGLRDPSAPQKLWRGRIQTTVRVVEVGKGRLWPEDRPGGYLLPALETPMMAEESVETRDDELTRELAVRQADEIAKLFYEHEKPHEGGFGDRPMNQRVRERWMEE